jgi:hypothetical protein
MKNISFKPIQIIIPTIILTAFVLLCILMPEQLVH